MYCSRYTPLTHTYAHTPTCKHTFAHTGAPATVRPLPAESSSNPLHTTKFSYLGNCWTLLEGVQKFVIATDNDAPGQERGGTARKRGGKRVTSECWRDGGMAKVICCVLCTLLGL